MAFNRYNKSGGGGGGLPAGRQGFRSGGFKGGGFRNGGFRDRNSERPEMHKTVCDNCGKDCEVPFRPTSGKPVFCSSCFENRGGGDFKRPEGRSFDRPSFEGRNNPQPQFEKQLKDLNDKMDKLLKLLLPNESEEITKEVAQQVTVVAEKPEEVVEEAPKKAKKT